MVVAQHHRAESDLTDGVADAASAARAHRTLEDAVRWGLAQHPPRLIADVVAQDEYTHDVVLPVGDGLYLVYDTT